MSEVGKLLIETITSADPAIRDRSVRELVERSNLAEKLDACAHLEQFRRARQNLYERVRASLFLHALYRYEIQDDPAIRGSGHIPFAGFMDLMERRYEPAIAAFLETMRREGPNGTISSALAQAYEQIAFQTLADQVRRSVRNCQGNRWMFRVGGVDEHPLRIHPALLERQSDEALFPILVEKTSVRLDLSHSGWSDIFFLGMDFPEGARVLNISVDLGVHGRDPVPVPPIEARLRVITEPILRLTSIDLNACKDVDSLEELFNFGNDYLGLIKAAVVASGLIPPALEGTHIRLDELLARIVRKGHGLEIVSKVNDIPKGSRLAVSTNLLASLITLLMRATGQARNLTGPLEPSEARVVVARAILGEWMGGSGGGWQDSGGIFPGIKLIEGVAAGEEDPEWGVSRGRLLPAHRLLNAPPSRESPAADAAQSDVFPDALARSLVLVHGGMAQNVGPILNMVTAKYLLRGSDEWRARLLALEIFKQILASVHSADVRQLGGLTTQNWDGPLKQIIPWVTNAFTESIIRAAREALGEDFWGFLMLGGMSGGGMAFFVAPHRHDEFQEQIAAIMKHSKAALDDALPFAMEPVVYDFRINAHGTFATLDAGTQAMMPPAYYTLQVPRMTAAGTTALPYHRRADVDHFANRCPDTGALLRVFRTTINHLFPVMRSADDVSRAEWDAEAARIRRDNGFDTMQHEQLRDDLQHGRIGLSRNRLPVDLEIRDVDDSELIQAHAAASPAATSAGESALRRGEVAIVTLAAGVGSRWTTGAGVVKAVNPFVELDGRHRGFLEIHLAKTRKVARAFKTDVPHIVTTSYLTHSAIERHLAASNNYGHDGPVYLSPGRSIGQRLIPMTRDLTFLWEEAGHEALDDNKQKVRDASRRAILDWARSQGEGTDYTDNLPIQRFNPPGHFHEVPNLLRNGLLAQLLDKYPNLQWLLVHNIDTLGAFVDPAVLGLVMKSAAALSFEVIPRRIDDRGGGLAKVAGRLRLLEGLAQPREDTEFKLRYYNSLTTWVRIDGLLSAFGLTRETLKQEPEQVDSAVRAMASRLPTYVTIKDVKRRWGHGQEDVYPIAQFEKLWGDMSLASRPELFLRRRRSPPWAAAQGHRPARRLGQRRQPGARAIALRLRAVKRPPRSTSVKPERIPTMKRAVSFARNPARVEIHDMKLPLDQISLGHCMVLMKSLPDGCVDLIVSSPPYNLGKAYESKRALEIYIDEQKCVLKECSRILKRTGSIFWQVGAFAANGMLIPLDVRFFPILESLGLIPRNRIVWARQHGLHASKKFSCRHETILWFTKSDDWIFNLDAIRVPQKYQNKKFHRGEKHGELSCNPDGKNPGDIWLFRNVKHNHEEQTIHPCQFPEDMISRIVLATSNKGDVVFDPYMGTGTVAVVAREHGRHFMGAESDPAYHSVALRRLKGEPDESGCFPNLKTLRDFCERTDKPVSAFRFDVQVGEKPTDRGLAKIYSEGHHLREMEDRLAYEEAAFGAGAHLRHEERPADQNLNGKRQPDDAAMFELTDDGIVHWTEELEI